MVQSMRKPNLEDGATAFLKRMGYDKDGKRNKRTKADELNELAAARRQRALRELRKLDDLVLDDPGDTP